MGRLLDLARRDTARIVSDPNGFTSVATFYPPEGDPVVMDVLHTKHHFGFDEEARKWANTKNAHLSFAESLAVSLGYIIRNAQREVFLQKHKVVVADSTGQEWTYRIEQWFPDETVGLICCILGDWEEA
jgi:hypothetical protein